jgi:uncharacterized protein DUF3455
VQASETSGQKSGFWVLTKADDASVDRMIGRTEIGAVALALLMPMGLAAMGDELPAEIAATGEAVVLRVHAVGAQIYECQADPSGHLSWEFREPIASLFEDGKTVGRHYAGPKWEVGGSVIVGAVVGHAPGATAKDIPWLKLHISDTLGDPDGPLEDVTTVQRINTKGGVLEGACEKAGEFQAEPYSADYIFLEKSP